MVEGSTDDITDGPVYRSLLVVAAPLFVQNFVRMLEQAIDLFWVGRYESEAVAAIGLATPLLWFLLTAAITTSFVGTQVLVSQRVGGDDHVGARRVAFTGLLLAIALALGVGAVLFFGVEDLLAVIASARPQSTAPEVIRFARIYLEVIATGVVFAAVSDVLEAAFIGWGDSRASLYMNVSSVVANLGLDPVFIFGFGPVPALGMRGAALATVSGWMVGLAIGVGLVARGRAGGVLTRRAATVSVGEVRELLAVGLPQGVKAAAGSTASIVMVVIAFAAGGGPGLAAFTVGSRVTGVVVRSVGALKQATQSVVGQNLGAGKPSRAGRTVWTGVAIASAASTAVGVWLWLLPGTVVSLLVPELRPEAFQLATTYLRILAFGFPVVGLIAVMKAGLNGARQTQTTMVFSILERWGLQIGVAFVGLAAGGGILIVFWARTVSLLVTAGLLTVYYLLEVRGDFLQRAAERADPS